MHNVSKTGKIDIVTNARRISAQLFLAWHDLMKHVDFFIMSDDVKKSKLFPEPYLKLLKQSGFDAHSAIALEDSEVEKLSATRAKMKTLVVND